MTRAREPVLTWTEGHLGRIHLNRREALNALTYEMVCHIQEALDNWATDPAVRTVAIDSAGERAFCAGGDIVSIYRDALSDQDATTTSSASFWRDEYALNLTIQRYPKPYVALMCGIVLGGGVGLSAHGSHRVVTETSSIGMPETGIGFFPDVGGTWLLSHAPGELGTHLALTAGSVNASDAIALGLADHFVPQDAVGDLLKALETLDAAEAIERFEQRAPEATLNTQRTWIDECYAHDSLPAIVEALMAHENGGARFAADVVRTKSPTSCAVTLRALRSARSMDLSEALSQELVIAVRFLDNPDFAEGIRAAVIDKDRRPQWNPSTAEQVKEETVRHYFEPLIRQPYHPHRPGGPK